MHLRQFSTRTRVACRTVIVRGLTLACALVFSSALPAATVAESAALKTIREARAAGHLDRALDYVNELIQTAPQLTSAYMERARILDARGEPAGARSDVDRVLALEPDWLEARALRAKLRLAAGEYEGVLEDLPLDRIGGEGLLNLRGQALIALGRFHEGLAIYKHLMSGPFGPNTNSRFPRALCLLGLGETQEAVEWFEADCGDGGTIQSRYQLALGNCLLGRYDQMQAQLASWLETADSAEPKNEDDRYDWELLRESRDVAVFLEGIMHFARGRFKEAAAALATVRPENSWSDDARLLGHLALVRMQPAGKPAIDQSRLQGSWAQTLGRFLRGELTESELLRLAGESRNAAERRRRTCQAAFYAGQRRFVAGDEFASTLLFERAVATRAVESPEYTLAAIALKPALMSP